MDQLLTPKQKKVLDYISSYLASRGYSPSYAEISRRFSLRSDRSVTQYLEALEQKGFIDRGEGTHQILPLRKDGTREVALLGLVAAGSPIEPLETLRSIPVPEALLPQTGSLVYALQVKGDSMINDGILDGDIILVKHQSEANNGDTVVAITENGATLKRYYSGKGRVRLEPRNPSLPTIFPRQLEIRGKFVGLIRRGPKTI